MNHSKRTRRLVVAAALLAVAALSAAVWVFGYARALDQLSQQAEADLALVSDRLSSQLEVYRELAVLLADHPALIGLEGPGRNTRRDAARRVLVDVADKTGALDIAFADRRGRVLVSATQAPGADLSATPEFRRAMHGALGSAHGLLGPAGQRAWSYAAPVFGPGGAVRGALVVRADIERLEEAWRGSTSAVFFTDRAGEVFITNRSELLFWRRDGTGPFRAPTGDTPPFAVRHVGGHEIWTLDWGPYLPRAALHLARDLPVIGLTGEVLVSVAPARRLAGLQAAVVAAICLAFGAMLYLATERRRTLALANAQLEARVADRTRALADSNARLRREIAERQEAEAALKRAQADLVQAGKLSALGQMSAGISHELNQPLMAIGQFADNGAAFLDRGRPEVARENLTRIATLAARAGRIIRNLRAFVRNESEPMGRVDLGQVVAAAVELTEGRARQEGVRLDWTPPSAPVLVWGGEVRLGQVFVNLLNNALDAMAGQRDKRVSITLEAGPEKVAVALRDTGPGIEDPERMFEPFYSTKPVGSEEGMGLGLSISYGLVQSFGGNIRGANAPEGGAVFTVELDRWRAEEAVA